MSCKVDATTLKPAEFPAQPDLEWCGADEGWHRGGGGPALVEGWWNPQPRVRQGVRTGCAGGRHGCMEHPARKATQTAAVGPRPLGLCSQPAH